DLERELQRAGKIGFFEFQVLDHLACQHGNMTMSQLAARCSSSLSRLSHVARKLETRKLLTRRLSEVDKRVTVAEITVDGQRLKSEEHTSELQSRFDLVCCLLLEKT